MIYHIIVENKIEYPFHQLVEERSISQKNQIKPKVFSSLSEVAKEEIERERERERKRERENE